MHAKLCERENMNNKKVSNSMNQNSKGGRIGLRKCCIATPDYRGMQPDAKIQMHKSKKVLVENVPSLKGVGYTKNGNEY